MTLVPGHIPFSYFVATYNHGPNDKGSPVYRWLTHYNTLLLLYFIYLVEYHTLYVLIIREKSFSF